MDNFFNKSQIETIVSRALEAGKIAEKLQKSADLKITTKPDDTKVTSADIAISKFLNQELNKKFPEIPIICEEGNLRQADDLFWLIDPIDGTNSFIDGSTEFATNIALVKNKKVIFGLIHAPLFEGGKTFFSNHQNQVVCLDKSGQKKITTTKANHDELRIITSTKTKDFTIQDYINYFYPTDPPKLQIEKLSSAVKFFRILENKADLYLHFRKSMEWDTAAGQILLELIGGKVKNLFNNEKIFEVGKDLSYHKPDFENGAFVGVGRHVILELQSDSRIS